MISVYDIGNTAFDKNGDVVLTPVSGKIKNVAAGQYDLTLEHPIDPYGKWTHLVPEAVIRSPIPKELIENAFAGLEADVYKTNANNVALREGPSEPSAITYSAWNPNATYQVGDKVSVTGWSHKNYKCVYYDSSSPTTQVPPYNSSWWTAISDYTSGSAVLVTLKSGVDLYYVETYNATWYKMSTTYGLEGYIKKSQVTYDRHLTPSETQDRIITSQLFRIKKATVDTKQMRVSVTAEHVSYDLNGVLLENLKISRKPPAQSLSLIESAFMIDYPGSLASNITEAENREYSADLSGKNGMYALLDPDKGMVAAFEAAFRRDNWDLFVMEKPEGETGFRITYGNNLQGVSWTKSSDQLINRVVPVAKDEYGNDLYLDGTIWVDSENIGSYPRIRMERLKVNGQVGKDDGSETGTNWTTETLRAEMLKQAAARFDTDKVDQLRQEITIDFTRLGDTEEYKQYKDLQDVRLYDTVTAVDPRIGLSVSVQVVEIEFDIVKEKITAMKLSNIEAWNMKNVTGFNVLNNSITPDKLTDDVWKQLAE